MQNTLFPLEFPADAFAPTPAETAASLVDVDGLDVLNEEGDGLFDLLDYDPFAKIGGEVADAANDAACRACCPYHGPHEQDEDGNALDYCERCEGRL